MEPLVGFTENVTAAPLNGDHFDEPIGSLSAFSVGSIDVWTVAVKVCVLPTKLLATCGDTSTRAS